MTPLFDVGIVGAISTRDTHPKGKPLSYNAHDYRAQALEAAEVTEDYQTIATVYAMTYVGDQVKALVDALPTLAMLHTALTDDESEPAHSNGESPQSLPRLARTLQADPPFADKRQTATVAGGTRQYTPAHDPRHWRPDPKSGKWISPAGRHFDADSRQVRGVLFKLDKMRRDGTLYTTPLRPLTGKDED